MLDGGRSATGGAPSTKTDSTPEEVANAALYLCSALSGNVTGFHAPGHADTIYLELRYPVTPFYISQCGGRLSVFWSLVHLAQEP
jgi:hypothetical protein